MNTKAVRLVLKTVTSFLGLILLAILVWPVSFGGTFQVTIVSGRSMEPVYHSGDFVISAKEATYSPGNIVVYHPKDIDCEKCNVVHRIIGGNAQDGWVTQGDNNPTRDGWQPKNDEIVGKVFYHFPLAPFSSLLFSKWFWITVICFGSFIWGAQLLFGTKTQTPKKQATASILEKETT